MRIYRINSREVPKAEFFRMLRQDCVKVASTTVSAGWCGVDQVVFDPQKYRQSLRRLRNGHILCFYDRGRTYTST